MIYSLSLQSVGIAVGVILLLGHAAAWVGTSSAMAFPYTYTAMLDEEPIRQIRRKSSGPRKRK